MRNAAQIVVFGATGDLMRRKLAPALVRLAADPDAQEPFVVVGVARRGLSQEAFRASLREALPEPARTDFDRLAPRVRYLRSDASDPGAARDLAARLDLLAADAPGGRLFYLSLAPRLFGAAVAALDDAGLLHMREGEPCAWRRGRQRTRASRRSIWRSR
jgi:glucose-6-phosphate 1-dehydrogenase